jgi:hypothetical protein
LTFHENQFIISSYQFRRLAVKNTHKIVKGKISRRKFIQQGALGALSTRLIADNLGKVIAGSPPKPPLTIAELNIFFQRIQAAGPATLKQNFIALQKNPEQFLVDNFTINPRQLESIRKWYSERQNEYAAFMKRGLDLIKANQNIPLLRVSFDAKVNKHVWIEGFGERMGGCGNEQFGDRVWK